MCGSAVTKACQKSPCALQVDARHIGDTNPIVEVTALFLIGLVWLGATMRLVMCCVIADIVGASKNNFSVVRYGNVIGSRGSVVPLFKDLIDKGEKYLPITDVKMTRFWLSLEKSVNFVISCFEKMNGGEIFVPKIPSVKITDLAIAMNSKAKLKIVGIRPGEKIHEQMCPKESSSHTLEFEKFFIIFSSDTNLEKKIKEIKKKTRIKGRKEKEDFEYSSGLNKKFLSIKEIKSLNLK